jgi:hypothetical protein
MDDFTEVTEIVLEARFTITTSCGLRRVPRQARATVLRVTDGEGGRVQDDPETLAAIGTIIAMLWERHWTPVTRNMVAEFSCLGNRCRLETDTRELPLQVVITTTTDLIREA